MRLTSSYSRVESGYMPLDYGSSEPSFMLMLKDMNNIVLNAFHLASTVSGQDDLAQKIETLPPEEQKKYAGYWKRVKQAIDRFIEGGDVPPSTGPMASRVGSEYMQHGFDDPLSQTVHKDLNNRVLNTLHLLKTLAGQDDLSQQIAALPPEKRKMFIGYWQRAKQAMDRFLEGEDTPPLTGPVHSDPRNYR